MLVAMVMSLGVMGGIATQNSGANLQQLAVGCGYMAGATEGGASGAWTAAAGVLGGTAAGLATAGGYAAVATTTNPVGWGFWAVTAVIAL